ncbi:MAG: Na-translocating system protein MpsB, partial [bacterium]|nr:Na-translocating system protein MpsB [bacterium]
EYDWTSDPDGTLLRSILQGPGVVMHMINMQYYCSTADPRTFGSQDKTRHNIVGDTGVLVGASGDLHYGLPWQSLGPTPRHQRHAPVRLRIHVAAPQHQLDRALSGTTIEQLVGNGWLTISTIGNRRSHTG